MCTVNGQLRPVQVRDTRISVDVRQAEKADTSQPGHVAAPFAGVVSLAVEVGQQINAGDTVATIEAMKMEAAITAPRAGVVERLVIAETRQAEGGDLLLILG
jgi:pyruvate carboxylase